jgi:hypothetical protein
MKIAVEDGTTGSVGGLLLMGGWGERWLQWDVYVVLLKTVNVIWGKR